MSLTLIQLFSSKLDLYLLTKKKRSVEKLGKKSFIQANDLFNDTEAWALWPNQW